MDWIETFLQYTDGLPSPPLFRLWAGISAIAGAAERRLWIRAARKELFPNLYILLVSPPGVGKNQSIDRASELLRLARDQKEHFYLAPDSVTSASILDPFAKAAKMVMKDGQILHEYASLFIASPEFGLLVPKHDIEFLSRLNYIYDNPPFLAVQRVYVGKDEIQIINPQLNILAGAQPGYLISVLPEEAWSMGTTARLIMIYSSLGPNVDIFADDNNDQYKESLWKRLVEIGKLEGEMAWEPAALDSIKMWFHGGLDPIPRHSRLRHYSTRRPVHTMKLSMISSLSRGNSKEITMFDFNRARDWLLQAETMMPDIFRELAGKSDYQLMNECYVFIFKLWIDNDKKPVHQTNCFRFLAERTTGDRVGKLVDLMENMHMLDRTVGTTEPNRTFTPNARHNHTME